MSPIGAAWNRLVLDEALRAKLAPLTNSIINIYDENDNLVGHYVSADVTLPLFDAARKCPYSKAELERQDRETGNGITLSEFCKKLRADSDPRRRQFGEDLERAQAEQKAARIPLVAAAVDAPQPQPGSRT